MNTELASLAAELIAAAPSVTPLPSSTDVVQSRYRGGKSAGDMRAAHYPKPNTGCYDRRGERPTMTEATHHETAAWRFNDSERVDSVVLDSREIRCYEGTNLAWRRVFKTRALARSSFEGDLRAMRKNESYRWVTP